MLPFKKVTVNKYNGITASGLKSQSTIQICKTICYFYIDGMI